MIRAALFIRDQQGPKGDLGNQGIQGLQGPGVPTGGAVGRFLRKKSSSDYDTEWVVVESGGGGGGSVNNYFPGGWA
jgi:hypothetical protein